MSVRSKTYAEFWPKYLAEHGQAKTRYLHFFGTALGIVLLAAGIAMADWRLIVGAIVAGYAFAWFAHAFVERNRPATFTHPFWSLISDFRMFYLWLTGRLRDELKQHGLT